MAALGQLVVSLSANIAQFQQSMDKASYLAEKNFNKIQSAAKTAAAAVTVYLSLNQVKDSIKSQLDYADQLAKTSQKVGVATETLSAYAYAAELAGVNFEQLQKSLIFLSKGSVDAARGMGEAKDAFDAMGITVKNTNGTVKSNEQLLEEVADKFAQYRDGAEKTAIAVKIFGKAGADMIPLLNGGSAAIKEAREEAEKFGLIIGSDFAKRAEVVNDNFTRLKRAGDGFALMLAETLLPKLERLTKVMVEATKEGGLLYGMFVGFGGVIAEAFSEEQIQKVARLKKEIAELTQKIADPYERFGKLSIPISAWEIENTKKVLENRKAELNVLIDSIKKRDEEKNKQKKTDGDKKAAPILLDPAAVKEAQKRAKEGADIINGIFAQIDTPDLEPLITTFDVFGNKLEVTAAQFEEMTRRAEEGSKVIIEQINAAFVQSAEASVEAAESVAYGWNSAGERVLIKLEDLKNETDSLKEGALEFGARLTSSFEEAILRGSKLRDIMQGLLQDIIKIAARKLITEPIGKAIAAGIEGMFGGGKALGGPVSGGSSYLVGERGPEIFTPAVSGNITPNNEIGGGVTVYQNINISTGVAQTVRAEVVGMMPRIMEATKAAVVDSKRRGGSFAKAFS